MFDFFNSFDMNLMIWIHQNLSNTIFDKLMPFITNKNNWIVPIASLIIILCFFSGKKGKFALFILIISLSVFLLIFTITGIALLSSDLIVKRLVYSSKDRNFYTLIDKVLIFS